MKNKITIEIEFDDTEETTRAEQLKHLLRGVANRLDRMDKGFRRLSIGNGNECLELDWELEEEQ